MKTRNIIALVFTLVSITPAFAQGGRGGGQGQGRGQGGGEYRQQMTEDNVRQRVDRLAQSLEMKEDQKTKIMDYELKAFKTNQVERQRLMGDREAMRSYMQKQRDEREKKYKEVLTEEQYKKYLEQREQRRQENPNRQRPSDNGDGQRAPRGRG